MSTVRVARTASAVLAHTFVVDETETDSTTDVTVALVDANGDAAGGGTAPHAGVGTGAYSYAFGGQAQLQNLVATWSGTIAGAAVEEVDEVLIVGGRYFTLKEGRNSDASLAGNTDYTTEDLRVARDEVESELEEICDRAFVPRYGRAVLDGTGTTELFLPQDYVRSIRAATIAPRVGQTPVALTGTQLAALAVTADQTVARTDGNVWTQGIGNVVVEFEYGRTSPPPDLKRAALIRLRSRLNLHKSGIPDRATSFTAVDGGTYRISLPAAYRTGVPEVDAVYSRYSRRSDGSAGGAERPASRQLNFDPQRDSLFHGGVR